MLRGEYAIYFLYKVAWEEFMLRGEYAIFRIKSSSVVSTPRGSV